MSAVLPDRKVIRCGRHRRYHARCSTCQGLAQEAGFVPPKLIRERVLKLAAQEVETTILRVVSATATASAKGEPLRVLLAADDELSIRVQLPGGGWLRGRVQLRFRWERERA